MFSSFSAATARGVRPSPQTLSRPCGPFSKTVTFSPARAATIAAADAAGPAADDDQVPLLHGHSLPAIRWQRSVRPGGVRHNQPNLAPIR